MARLLTVKNLFTLFLAVWFAYGVWEARAYAFLAKIFPFYISIVLLIFAVISIVMELRKAVGVGGDLDSKPGASDLGADWDIPIEEVWRRFGFYLALLLILYGCIYLIGYPLALTLFILLFYRRIARASWMVSILAGAAGLGFLALASHVLGMDWPEGLLRLPWPLG